MNKLIVIREIIRMLAEIERETYSRKEMDGIFRYMLKRIDDVITEFREMQTTLDSRPPF